MLGNFIEIGTVNEFIQGMSTTATAVIDDLHVLIYILCGLMIGIGIILVIIDIVGTKNFRRKIESYKH